jgi:pimeloyl-ACP methyl ester carboxylesterase
LRVRTKTDAKQTDVPAVALRYGEPGQEWLGEVTAGKLRGLQSQGYFAAGSMGPKVEAALRFVDLDVVDAGLAPAHEPALVELPQLVAVAAEPPSVGVVPLVLEADGDAVLPAADAARLAGALPNGRVEEVPDVNHFSMLLAEPTPVAPAGRRFLEMDRAD